MTSGQLLTTVNTIKTSYIYTTHQYTTHLIYKTFLTTDSVVKI